MTILPFVRHHPFSISYTHSIYLSPVVENYEAKGRRLCLKEILTDNWGVVEYYNITKAQVVRKEKEGILIHGIEFELPKIKMIIGYVGKQKLLWETQTYSFYSLFGPGEKIEIESISLSALEFFLRKIHMLLD